MIHIAGSPGQGNMTTETETSYWIQWLADSKADFDLLVFDPRGTGEGKGVWTCDAFEKKMRYVLSMSLPVGEEMKVLNQELAPCFDQLAKHLNELPTRINYSPEGLYAFSTYHQANDVKQIISAMDYQRVHLWGVSYGTRVALAAADNNKVKTLLLDSPYPFERGFFSDWPSLYDRTFKLHDNLFKKIMPQSNQSFGDVYANARSKLAKKVQRFDIVHWGTDEIIPFVLTPDRLLELSFSVLYNEQMYQTYYIGLSKFAQNGTVDENFKMIVEDFVVNIFNKGFNSMVYFATECVDNMPEPDEQVKQALSKASKYVGHYFSTSWQHNACKLYDFTAEKYVQDMSYTDKPTLIFSGSHDPVTPSVWGKELAQVLSRAEHIVVQDAGHGVLFRYNCGGGVINRIVKANDIRTLNITCDEQHLWQ